MQSDQQALDQVQVKAHDIRAFAASKSFLWLGFGGLKHAHLSLQGTQFSHQFLVKISDLERILVRTAETLFGILFTIMVVFYVHVAHF